MSFGALLLASLSAFIAFTEETSIPYFEAMSAMIRAASFSSSSPATWTCSPATVAR